MRPDDTSAPRESIATCDSYEEAQRAVDYLSDQRFPVEHMVIVGRDLRLVENVLGRLTYLRAAGMGAGAGAWFGLLIGLFFALFAAGPFSLALVLWGLIWGAVAGAVFGLIAHAFSGGRRDFLSARSILAGHYELLVAAPYAAEARRLLERGVPQRT